MLPFVHCPLFTHTHLFTFALCPLFAPFAFLPALGTPFLPLAPFAPCPFAPTFLTSFAFLPPHLIGLFSVSLSILYPPLPFTFFAFHFLAGFPIPFFGLVPFCPVLPFPYSLFPSLLFITVLPWFPILFYFCILPFARTSPDSFRFLPVPRDWTFYSPFCGSHLPVPSPLPVCPHHSLPTYPTTFPTTFV